MSWHNTTRPTKRIPGEKVRNMRELTRLHDTRGYAFIHGKCYHFAVWRNWSLASLLNCIASSCIAFAELNPAHPDNDPEKPAARAEASQIARRKALIARDELIDVEAKRIPFP